MSRLIEFRGNTVNDLGTSSFVTIEGLGVKPYIIDESISRTYVGGRYKRTMLGRLAFDFTFDILELRPSGTYQDNRRYWDLMEILYKPYKWIYLMDDEYYRSVDVAHGLVAAGRISFPMPVEVYDIGTIDDDFDNSKTEITGLTLCALNRIDLSA